MSVVTTSTIRPQHCIIQVIRLARKRHSERRPYYSVVLLKLDLFFFYIFFSFFIFNSFFTFSNTHHTRTHFMLKIRSVGENLIYPTVLSLSLSLDLSHRLICLIHTYIVIYLRPGYFPRNTVFVSQMPARQNNNIARISPPGCEIIIIILFIHILYTTGNYYLQRMPPITSVFVVVTTGSW